jgi:hypothetical protein
MTQTLGINNQNDIYLDINGNLALLSGESAVAGACATLSKAKLGEMVLSTTQGIPYDQAIFIGVPNLRIWQSYLLTALQNINGVVQVTDLKSTIVDNTLVYQATIQSNYGTSVLTNSILVI